MTNTFLVFLKYTTQINISDLCLPLIDIKYTIQLVKQ